MVQTPAPNSRSAAKNASLANWTHRFSPESASRLQRKVSVWTLASSALLLSGSLSPRSEANPPGPSPVFTSKSNTPKSTLPPASRPVSTPSQPALIAAPAPSIATKPPVTVLQIDASGAISSLPVPPQTSPQPTSSQPASSDALSNPEIAPSQPSSLPSSQPSSQPVIAPLSGASGAISVSENAAELALPPASSPIAATEIAPRTEAAASRAKAPTALPKIRVSAMVGGRERQAQIAVTPKMTVGQALAAMGVSLAILDRVTPDASALVRDGLAMRVTRIGSDLRTSRRAIPAEVRYQPTTKLRAGTKSTLQQAKAGTLETTERVWTRDGKVTKREFVSQRIAAQPRHKIVALGVNSHLLPSNVRPHRRYARALSYRGGSPRDRLLAPADPRTFAAVKSFTVLATGYSAGPAGGAIGNWTATGVRCTYGAVAVDPRLIPLGSKLYVEGYGYGFACDVGGAIKGKHIDLAFDSPAAAFRHGKKRVKVWILGP